MYINIHTHHLSNNQENTLDVYNQYPWEIKPIPSYYSIGIHPIFIEQSHLEMDLKTIEQHIQSKQCIALGEIGLDKITAVPFQKQIAVFEAQLQIAEQYQIPVIIHCVRAYQEILQIRNALKLTIPFIFHGFNKNQQIVNQILSNHCIPSFGKNLLYNQNIQTIFANLSEYDFFLETDDSDLSIEEIYKKAAEIRAIDVEELTLIINRNFQLIFNQK